MADLDVELTRVTEELASASRRAYELWLLRYRTEQTIDDRTLTNRQINEMNGKIKSLEEEKDLIDRALKYERMAAADPMPSVPEAEESNSNGHLGDLAEQVDKALAQRATVKRQPRQQAAKPSTNGRRGRRPKTAPETTPEPVTAGEPGA